MEVSQTNQDSNREFYVYILLDPRKPGAFSYEKNGCIIISDFEPFYVGKGSKLRYSDHICEAQNILLSGMKITKSNFPEINIHKVRKILKIIQTSGAKPIVKFLNNNLSENEAFELEIKYIKTIGRHNFNEGPLTNLTDGGEGVSNPSYEVRKQRSETHKGKTVSKETRLKQRMAKLGKKYSESRRQKKKETAVRGEKHWHYGKKGKNSPIYGFKKSKEAVQRTIKCISKAVLQYTVDGEFVKEWQSATEASRAIQKNRSNISACCRGTRKHVGGFVWKFKN